MELLELVIDLSELILLIFCVFRAWKYVFELKQLFAMLEGDWCDLVLSGLLYATSPNWIYAE